MQAPTAIAVDGPANAWVAPIGKFKEGGILATRDGGKTWSVQSTRNVYYLSGLSMQSETSGWAIGYVFGETFGQAACGNYTTVVFKTTSGGASWDPVPRAVCGFSGTIAFADATRGWISVRSKEGSSIFVTEDGGTRWTKQLDLPRNVTALQIFGDGSGWAVAEGLVLRYQK